MPENLGILWDTRGSDYIMIQNPPSIPILLIVILFKTVFSRETKLIIDWHNLNYTILNLRYNNLNHPFVKLVKLYGPICQSQYNCYGMKSI